MQCERCGKEFDYDDAEDLFCLEHPGFNFDHFYIRLCGECAIKAVDEEEHEIYYEDCSRCGKRFDYFAVQDRYNANHYYGLQYSDLDDVYCGECAEMEDNP